MAVSIGTDSEFKNFIRSNKISVIHFYAPWAAQCELMHSCIEELSKQTDYGNVSFGKVEAEELSEVSLQYKITAVPTIVIFKAGNAVATVNGASPADLVENLNKVIGASAGDGGDAGKKRLEDRLKSLVKKADVMVFMKGNPSQPRCGFSRTLIGILNETKVPYETFDILQDEDVRQGLKTFSNWPTYPQIYVKGELIGGLDIIQELKQSGELVSSLKGN